MSPTPVTFASPTKPAGWSWEATSEEVAKRYGLALDQVVRFDQNTAPSPPGAVHDVLRAGGFEVELSEYPPSDYGRLIDAAAARYGVAREELLVGAGADEILDLVAKTFIPAGGAAIIPVPTYPMYGILTEQRAARVIRVARRPIEDGFALDVAALRAAAATPDAAGVLPSLIWLCNPNNPTATTEPPGRIASLLDGLAEDASSAGRPAPIVLLDEAYIEFGTSTSLPLRERYAGLVVTRTLSKAYGIAGLRVGFAIATPERIDDIATYRPPGSVSVVSIEVGTALLRDERVVGDRVEAMVAERRRFAEGLASAGWTVHPSATNFLLVSFELPAAADVAAEGLLARGLVPRTFPAGHPLDHCLRLTVRNRQQDDRLIGAAHEIAPA